jgi:hypothetical protein
VVAFAAVIFLAALIASGCGASVDVRVVVDRSGAGTVTLTITVPKATAAKVEDLRAGLPVADLRLAGWVVDGPHHGPAGSTWVSASHPFSSLSQVQVLVADIAGSGPVGARPFQLAIGRAQGFLEDRFTARGTVDLDCSMACFDDPRLAEDVGYPLGVAPSQLAHILGPHPDQDISFRFEVSLPGRVSSSDAAVRTKNGLVWAPALGRSTLVVASTESVNLATVGYLLSAVGTGVLVVLATAGGLVVRRRRRLAVPVTGPS